MSTQWTEKYSNPFKALAACCAARGDTVNVEKAKAVLLASMDWPDVNAENYLDDLLQEVAGETNVVIQYLYEAPDWFFRAAYDEPEPQESQA